MKHVLGLKKTILASAVAASMVVPGIALAEVSASLGASNFYLWRGQDLSAGGGVIHGSLDYAHDSGLYAGVWGSSENGTGGEYDLYAGFGGEASGLSYDISYWSYQYPYADQGAGESGEIILGLGLDAFGFTYITSVADDEDGDKTVGDYNYASLDYTYDKFNFLVGSAFLDADDSDYTHLDVSYSPIENLTFTASKVVSSDDSADVTDDQDLLFFVGYTFPL